MPKFLSNNVHWILKLLVVFLNVVTFFNIGTFYLLFHVKIIILLKENDSRLLSLLLINNMLGWCWYLLILFITGSMMSLCSSIIHEFSFICRLLVAFLRKLFSSSDTKCSRNIIFSFWSTRTILFLAFLCSFVSAFLLQHTMHGLREVTFSLDVQVLLKFIKISFQKKYSLLVSLRKVYYEDLD